MDRHKIGIGLIGFGAVGGEVARVLMNKADMLAEQVGCSLSLQRVKVLPPDLLRPQTKEMAPELFTTDAEEFFSDPEIDIVVEVIGGEDPAMAYIQRALSSGKHVVTANKEVVAKHGGKL